MSCAIIRCQACRFSLLDAFTALAGISVPSRTIQPLTRRSAQSPRRTLHTARSLWQSLEPSLNHPGQDGYRQPPSDQPSESSAPSSDTVPWYLQVDTPSPPTPISPLLSSYDIPQLPMHPPPILQPILEHLSISIGLSQLTLLDLRTLDPPSALGSNLIMIIGTARSTKHLNVSADRFCRWLRIKYKLRPYADGLMGRQELKLKLRRRARRMKLAQSVGRTGEMKVEDEITTGWVCVNVGPIPDAVEGEEEDALEEVEARQQQGETMDSEEEEYENPEVEATYVGFGSQTVSPRIVVQMFTEEKRLEMDLEGLWEFRGERREKKIERTDIAAEAQESMWRQKLHEPIVELKNDPWRDAEEENRREESGEEAVDGEEGEVKNAKQVAPEKTRIKKEIDDPVAGEGEGQEKPMGGIGAS